MNFSSLFLDSYSPHLKVAHQFWEGHLKKGDVVLDATLGNGHDTAFVSNIVLPEGKIYAIDLQQAALQKSQEALGNLSGIEWILDSHATFPLKLQNETLDLAIYNLGYLPGGDKTVMTNEESTLESLRVIRDKIKVGGMISITTYSGHVHGDQEEQAVFEWISLLERKEFGVITFAWSNRPHSPKLSILKKHKS